MGTLNACDQWPIDLTLQNRFYFCDQWLIDLTLQNRFYFVFIAEFVKIADNLSGQYIKYNNNNNNNNNLFTYIAPFNIYGMIKGALRSKKTNIKIDNYNKNAITIDNYNNTKIK